MVFLCIASIVWSSIALHGIALHRIAWHCIAFDYLLWYCMVLQRLHGVLQLIWRAGELPRSASSHLYLYQKLNCDRFCLFKLDSDRRFESCIKIPRDSPGIRKNSLQKAQPSFLNIENIITNIYWFWTSYSEECNSPSESMMNFKILILILISNIDMKILSLNIGYILYGFWLTFNILY